MKRCELRLLRRYIVFGFMLAAIFTDLAFAVENTTYKNSDFLSKPVNLSGSDVVPLVMLNVSRDHQLSYKAYNDYSNLDTDSAPETTYKDSIKYYGYFDNLKCYNYSSSRFVPAAMATGDNKHYCTGQWSGNFMNWASMTRMDVVRKILYGGFRSEDTADLTVLERQYLPTDAHAFAKYYNGDDIDKLTPFSGIATTPPEASSSSNITITTAADLTDASRTKTFTTTTTLPASVGDQVKVFVPSYELTKMMIGRVTATTTTTVTILVPLGSYLGSGSYTDWKLINLSQTGITLCNLTLGTTTGLDQYSHSNTKDPLIRVAKGNFALWTANERWQGYWSGEKSASNGNKAFFSGIFANDGNPTQTTHGLGGSGSDQGQYVARVEVGNSAFLTPELIGSEKLKVYGTSYKPIGLLQSYGDKDQIFFGLMTGTFAKNISGGVLRKNAESFKNEVNSDNGTFVLTAYGIVDNLNKIRIYGYNYSDGTYISGTVDNCNYQQTGLVSSGGSTTYGKPAQEGNCSSWGNPMSEVYLESLRYLAGKSANSTFTYTETGSKDKALGLALPSWTDPLRTDNYCAPLNVINFNASVSSNDGDQMTLVSDLGSSESASALTNTVGINENIDDSSWFISNNGTTSNDLCTSKTIGTGFGSFSGLCPEAPTLMGTYQMSGVAWYANTNRIRSDRSYRENSRDLMVSTYGVALATNVPKIEVTVEGNKKVTILPAFRLDRATASDPYGGGGLVDFKIVEQEKTPGYGKYYVSWEVSAMGGDYDQDLWGVIEYQVSGSQITITTTTIIDSASRAQGFGYTISGTSQDGAHFHSGAFSFNYTDPTGAKQCPSGGCQYTDPPSSHTYSVTGSSTGVLQDPLYYTAKYGGFLDSNNSKTPDLVSEWDAINNTTGDPGSDSVPDNFFYASNPLKLEDALNRTFLAILQRASSGTAAAVVANNVSGDGAMYQAYYEPAREDGTNSVSWIGTVQALWLDSYGYIREDNNSNAVLDDYKTDQVIQQFYDETTSKTKVRRYTSTKDTEFAPYYMVGRVTSYNAGTGAVEFTVEEVSGTGTWSGWTVSNLATGATGTSNDSTPMTTVGSTSSFTIAPTTSSWFTIGDRIEVAHFETTELALEDVETLWNARKQLSFKTADADVQRDFSAVADDTASGGRHIVTWIDAKTGSSANGVVETSELVDFTRSSINSTNYGFFNVATEADAKDLVDYVRGVEKTGYRNRTIKYDGTTSEVIRLGDVVNSTPTVVGEPKEEFHNIYKDDTYGAFKRQYLKRRQVLYVGSNDGMLHAFNGGFYESATKKFSINGKKWDTTTDAVAHPLGSELWAYVPMNLLPHLKWLKDPNYAHVYYMDAKPRVFDAKIFDPTGGPDTDPADTDHPNGWGTVMVVGMRFGGGQMDINIADVTEDPDTRAFRSAYVIMDITNPEVPPTLLAEIQVPDGSLSTSYPTAIAIREKDGDPDKWFLLFGSGPTDIASAESTGNAKFYAFDLDEIRSPGTTSDYPPGCELKAVGTNGTMKIISCDTGVANSFVSNPVSVDWDLDYKADSAYFGVVGDTASTSGQVMRFGINEEKSPGSWVKPATLIDVSQPVVSAVTPAIDKSGNKWIFFGTGRFFVGADKDSVSPPQSIYGVKDTGSEVVKGDDLIDVTAAEVKTDGYFVASVGTSTNVKDLEKNIDDNYKGWYLDLPAISGTAGTDPATRVINSSPLTGGVLFTAAYEPGSDDCTGEGSSRLYGLYYKTGTAYPDPAILGTATIGSNEIARSNINLGRGFAASPSVHSGTGTGSDAVTVLTQLSTGTVVRTEAKTVTPIRSGMTSWIEPH